MADIVVERLRRADCGAGFVLDGFPRTIAQAEALEAQLSGAGLGLRHVVSLSVPDDEILRRLAGRTTCAACGRPWPSDGAQAGTGRCTCGGTLVTRDDDRPDYVRRRLEVYARQTRPLIDWYARRGLLRDVDGTGDPEAVAARIDASLAQGAAR
jgi:adenylate kinase